MNLSDIIGSPVEGVVPDEIAPFLQALLEGRIKQFVLVAEHEGGEWATCYPVLDDSADTMAMLGGIDIVKRDYMRTHVPSRIEYQSKDES